MTEANTAQRTTASDWPAARNTIVGINTIPGNTRPVSCRARPRVSGAGNFASGWRRAPERWSEPSVAMR